MVARVSKNPKHPNHLYRGKDGMWHWQVYHSSAGMAGGKADTRKAAIVAAKLAIVDLLAY